MRLLADLLPGDPAEGLAIEEVLLESARQDACETIRLWVNQRAVILGRSQSARAEVDEAQAQRLGIPILRRISGGGTVYHYPGNLNLSCFVHKRPALSDVSSVFRFFGNAITKALASLAPDLCFEDNGLYVNGLKVGGAAQARRGDAVLYHTTLLVQPSPVSMETLLLAMRAGYRSQVVASRPRRTTSMADHLGYLVSHEQVVEPVIDGLACSLNVNLDVGRLTPREAARAATLKTEKYGSVSWNRKL